MYCYLEVKGSMVKIWQTIVFGVVIVQNEKHLCVQTSVYLDSVFAVVMLEY